jgi:acyl dehydratase
VVTPGALRWENDAVPTEGLSFERFQPGDRYQTLGRTVSDFEILQFVTLTGFTEPLFMDMEYVRRESVFGTRVAPGVLTFALAEGLTLQTGILHGTGLALLSYDVRVLAPVLAGDTISVEIEVVDRRETKKPDRGVVTFRHRIANQRGEPVMEATIARMIKRGSA